MKDIVELVIKIPEKLYKQITVEKNYFLEDGENLCTAVENGTPLPKGHGRLIDASYKISSDGRTIDTVCGYMAPTIIEADNESEEER